MAGLLLLEHIGFFVALITQIKANLEMRTFYREFNNFHHFIKITLEKEMKVNAMAKDICFQLTHQETIKKEYFAA